jgi:hypothetical protein
MPSSTVLTGVDDMPSQPHAADRPWRFWSVAIVVLVVAVAALLAFIVLPVVQGQSAGLTAFAAICRSLGLQAGSPAARQPSSETIAQPVSMVSWTPQVIERLHHPNMKNVAPKSLQTSAPHAMAKTACRPIPNFPICPASQLLRSISNCMISRMALV